MTAISWERIEIHSLPDTKNVPLGFWEGRVKEFEHPELKAIFVLPNRDEAARFTAEKALEVRAAKEDPVYTLPSSMQGNDVLRFWVKLAKERGISFDKAQFYHTDEYYPISPDDKESFRKNLWDTFYTPMGIAPSQVHEIQANPGTNGDNVASDYETKLANVTVDLLIHPIGPGGHMGFNESGTDKNSVTHLTQLSHETVHRDHVIRGRNTPDHAITQGIATMLRAKSILLIGLSEDYTPAIKEALYGPIGEQNPSSLLRTVGDKVEVVLTKEIADAVIPPSEQPTRSLPSSS